MQSALILLECAAESTGLMLFFEKSSANITIFDLPLLIESIVGSAPITSFPATLSISFLLDERLNGENITVRHLTANGTLKNYTATVEDGKISIQVNELGTFVMGVDSEAVRQAGIKELHGVAIEQEEEKKKNGMGLVLFAAAAVLLIGICIAVGIITKKKIYEE